MLVEKKKVKETFVRALFFILDQVILKGSLDFETLVRQNVECHAIFYFYQFVPQMGINKFGTLMNKGVTFLMGQFRNFLVKVCSKDEIRAVWHSNK